MLRLVILISGSGRNLQAIIEQQRAGRLPVEICAVISSQPQAYGLQRARAAGIPALAVDHRAHASRAEFERALQAQIDAHRPDLVVLAGFMRILGSDFVQHYRGRLLNIHPSLLPKYRGLDTHARALAAGDAWHGASVHYVTEDLDGGPVVLQGRTALRPDDTPESLAARVMQDVEVLIYPRVLAWAAQGRLALDSGGRVRLDGKVLEQPLQWHELPGELE